MGKECLSTKISFSKALTYLPFDYHKQKLSLQQDKPYDMNNACSFTTFLKEAFLAYGNKEELAADKALYKKELEDISLALKQKITQYQATLTSLGELGDNFSAELRSEHPELTAVLDKHITYSITLYKLLKGAQDNNQFNLETNVLLEELILNSLNLQVSLSKINQAIKLKPINIDNVKILFDDYLQLLSKSIILLEDEIGNISQELTEEFKTLLCELNQIKSEEYITITELFIKQKEVAFEKELDVNKLSINNFYQENEGNNKKPYQASANHLKTIINGLEQPNNKTSFSYKAKFLLLELYCELININFHKYDNNQPVVEQFNSLIYKYLDKVKTTLNSGIMRISAESKFIQEQLKGHLNFILNELSRLKKEELAIVKLYESADIINYFDNHIDEKKVIDKLKEQFIKIKDTLEKAYEEKLVIEDFASLQVINQLLIAISNLEINLYKTLIINIDINKSPQDNKFEEIASEYLGLIRDAISKLPKEELNHSWLKDVSDNLNCSANVITQYINPYLSLNRELFFSIKRARTINQEKLNNPESKLAALYKEDNLKQGTRRKKFVDNLWEKTTRLIKLLDDAFTQQRTAELKTKLCGFKNIILKLQQAYLLKFYDESCYKNGALVEVYAKQVEDCYNDIKSLSVTINEYLVDIPAITADSIRQAVLHLCSTVGNEYIATLEETSKITQKSSSQQTLTKLVTDIVQSSNKIKEELIISKRLVSDMDDRFIFQINELLISLMELDNKTLSLSKDSPQNFNLSFYKLMDEYNQLKKQVSHIDKPTNANTINGYIDNLINQAYFNKANYFNSPKIKQALAQYLGLVKKPSHWLLPWNWNKKYQREVKKYNSYMTKDFTAILKEASVIKANDSLLNALYQFQQGEINSEHFGYTLKEIELEIKNTTRNNWWGTSKVGKSKIDVFKTIQMEGFFNGYVKQTKERISINSQAPCNHSYLTVLKSCIENNLGEINLDKNHKNASNEKSRRLKNEFSDEFRKIFAKAPEDKKKDNKATKSQFKISNKEIEVLADLNLASYALKNRGR